MNENSVKKAIERIIREEVRKIVAQAKDTARKEIRTQLIPEVRAAIRNLIGDVIEEMEVKPLSAGGSVDASKTAHAEVPGSSLDKSASPETVKIQDDTRGRYLYCVAEGNEEKSLGRIGIDHSQVYTIPYKDLCAVVHNCPPEPYKYEDEEVVKDWVKTHQAVLDMVTEKFGTILPLGFDTIIKDDERADPEKTVKKWLEEDYDDLKRKMEEVRGKTEYGIQIFWNPKIIGHKTIENNEEIRKIDQEIKLKPKGMAYMYKQRLEKVLKKEIEKKADQYFKSFYERIKKCVNDLKVEKTKKTEETKQMLLNLSCLIGKNGYKDLAEELEKIDKMDGFTVRFTGPWPPYSFVS